jgi:hypothetical protein
MNQFFSGTFYVAGVIVELLIAVFFIRYLVLALKIGRASLKREPEAEPGQRRTDLSKAFLAMAALAFVLTMIDRGARIMVSAAEGDWMAGYAPVLPEFQKLIPLVFAIIFLSGFKLLWLVYLCPILLFPTDLHARFFLYWFPSLLFAVGIYVAPNMGLKLIWPNRQPNKNDQEPGPPPA